MVSVTADELQAAIAKHEREKHPELLPSSVARAIVEGAIIVPNGVLSNVDVEKARLREALTDVRARMTEAHKLEFYIPPIRVIIAGYDVDYFSHTVSFHERVRDILLPCSVPTIGLVVGVSHDWGGASLPSLAISIGGAVKPLANVAMHELGHTLANDVRHTKNEPRTVRSWFGFGPSTRVYDVMSDYQEDGIGIMAFHAPLEQVEFTGQYLAAIQRTPYLRPA